jgi:hypothetical protein
MPISNLAMLFTTRVLLDASGNEIAVNRVRFERSGRPAGSSTGPTRGALLGRHAGDREE